MSYKSGYCSAYLSKGPDPDLEVEKALNHADPDPYTNPNHRH